MLVVTNETERASTTLGGLQQVCPEPLAHAPAAQHAFRPARAAACHASMRRHAAVEWPTPDRPPCTPRCVARCSTRLTRGAQPAPPSAWASASDLSLSEV